MDYYDIWCDISDGSEDLIFTQAVANFLGELQAEGRIEGYTFARRKFGFSPPGLGEFHIRIAVRDLAQLDDAFDRVTPRSGEMEWRHAEVFRRVVNFKSALYRDFPDPNRTE